MTTSVIHYQKVNATGTTTVDREAMIKTIAYTASSADDTANLVAITIADINVVQDVISAQIKSTGNVYRAPQGAVTFTGSSAIVTVNDTGLAVNEVIYLTVVGYAS